MTRSEYLVSLRSRARIVSEQFQGIDVGNLYLNQKGNPVTQDMFFGGPLGYDESLDSTTVAGKERREREEKSLQEHLAARAKFYEDNPGEVDVDSLVDDYYDRMFQQVYG